MLGQFMLSKSMLYIVLTSFLKKSLKGWFTENSFSLTFVTCVEVNSWSLSRRKCNLQKVNKDSLSNSMITEFWLKLKSFLQFPWSSTNTSLVTLSEYLIYVLCDVPVFKKGLPSILGVCLLYLSMKYFKNAPWVPPR